MFARAFVVVALSLVFGPVASSQTPSGILVLRNARWERVQVELRLGASRDCTANAAMGVRTLRRGQTWTVVSTEVVCWRREAVPGDAERRWTEWNGAQAVSGARREVEL